MYKLSENGVTLTREDGSVLSIPAAEGNRHWREYQEWLAEGNTPEPQFTAEEWMAKEAEEAKAQAEQELLETRDEMLEALEMILNGTPIDAVKAQFQPVLNKRANAKSVIGGA